MQWLSNVVEWVEGSFNEAGSVVAWVDEAVGCFKVANTSEFAKTWGCMKSNRSEEINYEKMSHAMRYHYHYGCERQGRKDSP